MSLNNAIVRKGEARARRLHRTARRVAIVGATTGGLGFALAAPSFAVTTGTDLTNGSGDTFFSAITGYFTGNVLVSVLTLLAVVVGASMLIGWGKKAAKSK